MKKDKIIYWTTTSLVSIMMLFSAFSYFTNAEVKGSFTHLGFPDYFRIELGIAKALGAIVLLLPVIRGVLKEVAYAGFAITFVSAFIAHLSSSDPISMAVVPLVFLAILITSYFYSRKIVQIKN